MTQFPDTCWIVPEFRRPQGGFEQKKSRKNQFLTLRACTPRRKRSYTMIFKITQDLNSGKRILSKSHEKTNKDFQSSNRSESIRIAFRHFRQCGDLTALDRTSSSLLYICYSSEDLCYCPAPESRFKLTLLLLYEYFILNQLAGIHENESPNHKI